MGQLAAWMAASEGAFQAARQGLARLCLGGGAVEDGPVLATWCAAAVWPGRRREAGVLRGVCCGLLWWTSRRWVRGLQDCRRKLVPTSVGAFDGGA